VHSWGRSSTSTAAAAKTHGSPLEAASKDILLNGFLGCVMRDKREFQFQIKKIDEAGSFEGFLSTYSNIDSQGDVVEAGAFKKTLADSGGRLPLLWQHRQDEPIGTLTVEDRHQGLFVRGRLLLEVGRAKEAYALLRAQVIKGLSIGFQTVREEVRDGVRHLLELKLFEGSLVSFPSNSEAVVTSIKTEIEAAEIAALQRIFRAASRAVETTKGR